MKRNGTARLFAALLALVMVAVLLPIGSAFAMHVFIEVSVDLGDYQPGSTITLDVEPMRMRTAAVISKLPTL